MISKEIPTTKEPPIKAVVTTRKYDYCGQHVVGITIEESHYLPSKLRMSIELIEEKIEDRCYIVVNRITKSEVFKT